MLTITILLLADVFGFIPDERRGLLEGRKKFAETLAVQTTLAASRDQLELVKITFDTLVSRNGDVVSASLKDAVGESLVTSGDHAANWETPEDGQSTPTHVQVPIFRDNEAWGQMEVVFKPVGTVDSPFGNFQPLHVLLALFSVLGFIAYLIFIKRTLRELDPGAVVPERVMSAFNTLAEGVLILDDRQQIVLANTAFTEKIGKEGVDFRGKKANSIGWDIDPNKSDNQLPWTKCIDEGEHVIDQPLRYGPESDKRVFMINATPIGDAKGDAKGVLVTFDDITDLERKRIEQSQTMARLEKSEKELQDRTIALEFLAARDPLTGCFNRRAFFEKFEKAFERARENNTPLACLMVDVDKFKNVNDTYGHHVGDQVIKFIADTLRANSRGDDVVGRMGGEEFCMILPGVDPDRSVAIAERIRIAISESQASGDVPDLRITSSFGISQIDKKVSNPQELVNRSDEGLYVAKETGRNKTVLWSKTVGKERAEVAGQSVTGDTPAQQPVAVASVPQSQPIKPVDAAKPATTDELTGTGNRKSFLSEVNKAVTKSRDNDHLVAVATVDINSFKRVNGALGHVVGDKLLKRVSDEIVNAIAELDTKRTVVSVARLANDEFGLLLKGFDNATQVQSWMNALFNLMSERVDVEGHQIILNFSAGVSLRTESKRREGNNIVEFFSEEINRSSYKRLWLESQLHDALDNGQFQLHYQPKTHVESGRIECMEALIRWSHPKVGDISPNEFISVAENTGFICNIGEWVLEEACIQGQKWREQGIKNLRVAVNLSNVQLRQADIEERIVAILEKTGFPADLLELEITETAFLNDFDHAVTTVTSLRSRGVHFALDDFGTGYSSLNTLKELPFDSIKIDRSFIGDSVPSGADKEILGAIIKIAHTLEIPVVAEGVETKATPYIALLLCLAGTLAALISIMAFFLGTSDDTIFPFIWLQIALAVVILATIPFAIRVWKSAGRLKTPAWLLVALVVVTCLMLLGEISVLVARVKVNEQTTYLYHLPSACIIVYCVGFWSNAMRLISQPAISPFDKR